MEFWEFLIQKEGNRSWLPLESPSVEILAGRYRVVARSSRVNTPTEVRVTHYAVTENPPVRRVRKRSSQTNADGLVVILPFTRLQPGIWELRCTSDVMAEMLGENWRYTVQLEVVAETAVLPADPSPVPDLSLAVAAAEGNESDALVPPLNVTPLNGAGAIAVDSALEAALSPSTELTSEPLSAQPGELAESLAAPDLTNQSVSDAIAHPPDEDNSADFTNAALLEPADATPRDLAEVLQQIEQQSEQAVNAAFQELANLEDLAELSAASSAEEISSAGDLSYPSQTLSRSSLPQLQVILEQETYIIQRGEVVALSGRIEPLGDAPLDPAAQSNFVITELRVRLYDPQTSEMLMDEVYPIDNRVPPFPFSGTVSLPEHYQTYLVLGELIFQGSMAGSQPQVLAARAFNVTTDLHQLIESIANDFPDVEALPPEAQIPEIAEPMPAAELERLNTQPQFRKTPQNQLPPQLHPPHSTRTHAALELPTFVRSAAQRQQTVEPISTPSSASNPPSDVDSVDRHSAEPSPSSEATISTSAADLVPVSVPGSEGAFSETEMASRTGELTTASADPTSETTDKTGSRDADAADLFPDWDEINGRVPIWKQRPLRRPLDTSTAPEDVSFRSLNLQDRFWMRLQSLATNPNVSATLGAETAVSAFGADRTGADQSVAPLSQVAELASRKYPVGLDADLTAHEIVVEDEPLPRVVPLLEKEPEAPADLTLSPILPEDEPIPTPRLQLPTGELTADQPVQLTVKLPNLLARVYVKLWLRDRQTRELLGTPRWIIDFVPDGFGNQMARTEVIVPPGCLKVQFEAIAVEIATQRESDKTTMTRPVVPPDLSPLSLDKLEI